MADEDDVIEEEEAEAEEAEAEDDAELESPPELTELEELASEYGWSPKADWRGEENDWVDAKQFLRKTPDAYKALRKTVENQDRTIAEMRDTQARMSGAAAKAEERAYQRAVADLEARKRAAVVEGDEDAYDAADAELKEVEKDRPAPDVPDEAAAKAQFDAFQRENTWYGGTSNADIRRTQRANELAAAISEAGFRGEAFYEKLAELVNEEFESGDSMPKKPNRPARVEGGRTVTRKGPAKQGYNDLPAEAKQVCDEFVSQSLYVNDDGSEMSLADARKAYAADYFAEEGAA